MNSCMKIFWIHQTQKLEHPQYKILKSQSMLSNRVKRRFLTMEMRILIGKERKVRKRLIMQITERNSKMKN